MARLSFDGTTVLITGASRGLGLALLMLLSERGAKRVYACCRTQEGCDQVAALQLSNVEPVMLDVTSLERIKGLADHVGQLDVLINNAGIASACGYSNQAALEIAQAEMDVHYFGPLALVRAFLPRLHESSKPAIINISSIAGISNFRAMGTYSASKAAQHFLTQGLRAELADAGIFVQGVYPGPFDTRLAAGYDGPKLSPKAIANVILDSCSDGIEEVFPDDFSQAMYQTFLDCPTKLAAVFSA